jgi:hypothetical protein
MEQPQLAAAITELLKEALALDPVGFSKMILAKHPINEALAEHPTIQVGLLPSDQEDRYIRESGVKVTLVDTQPKYGLSAIGLLNGLLDGNQAVAAVIEEESNKILEFIIVNVPAEPAP